MSAASALGAVARALSRTQAGHAAGVVAYRAAARIAGQRLARLDDVRSVYLTGSVARTLAQRVRDRVEPGYSDIDLVVVGDFGTVDRELAVLARLRAWQRRASVLGGLFYNLDCLDVREVDYARAFGGAFEMRLDRQGRCVAGTPLWRGAARRPLAFERREWFGIALRRWFNTGARLLDPTIDGATADALRAARRLTADLAELWASADLVDPKAPLGPLRALAGGAAMPSTQALCERGLTGCGVGEIRTVLVPAALEMLDAFAREVSAGCDGVLDVTGRPPPGDTANGAPLLDFETLAYGLSGAPFESVLLVRKGVGTEDLLPLVLAEEGASIRHAVSEFVTRLTRVTEPLTRLARRCRRPALVTPAVWAALSFAEPSPFIGVSAMAPLFLLGPQPTPPAVPQGDALAELLRARIVQSFIRCRGIELRPKMSADHRRRAFAEHFALLDALDRAVDGKPFDLAPAPPSPIRSERERVERLHQFSARHRMRLEPLLARRL